MYAESRKMVQMNLFAGQVGAQTWRTVGEGEGGMNWGNNIDLGTLADVRQIAGGKLLCITGSSALRSVGI